VSVHAATSMDAPNTDAGEEHPHTNTQLFGTVAPEDNRFVSYEQMKPPFNAPDDRRGRRHGSTVTQDGYPRPWQPQAGHAPASKTQSSRQPAPARDSARRSRSRP
jgi:hypothetical protein